MTRPRAAFCPSSRGRKQMVFELYGSYLRPFPSSFTGGCKPPNKYDPSVLYTQRPYDPSSSSPCRNVHHPLAFHYTQGLVPPQPTATADRVVYGKLASTRSVRRKAGEGV